MYKQALLVMLTIASFTLLNCDGDDQRASLLKQSFNSSFGKSVQLDGVNDVVRVPDHPALNFGEDQNFTVSARFKAISSNPGRIIYKYGSSGYAICWSENGDAGRLSAMLWADGQSYNSESTYTINDGEWHQVTIVRISRYLMLAIDGVLDLGIMASTGSVENSSPFFIGADPDNGIYFDGSIDEVRVWNYSRTPEQIRKKSDTPLESIYYSTADSGLVAYYQFESLEDLGVGFPGANDIRDMSVNGIHGELLTNNEIFQSQITLQFNSMNPHIGEKFEVRVIDQGRGAEVGRKKLSSITNSNFEIIFYTTIPGHSYLIEFYADHNNNGSYDSPPDDHAWQMALEPAHGNDTLVFQYNTNFTDIQWEPMLGESNYSAIWTVTDGNPQDGTTRSYTAEVLANFDDKTIEMALKADDTDSFPWLELNFSGDLIIEGDSIVVVPRSNRHTRNRLLASGKSLLKGRLNTEWSGALNWNNSQIQGDVGYNLTGSLVDVSVDGSLGATQAILNFHNNTTGVMGRAVAIEDTLLSNEVPTSVRKSPLVSSADGFTLLQNYPNPFNPTTTISFLIPAFTGNTNVTLNIFNTQGQLIRSLFSGQKTAGHHTVRWDGTNEHGSVVANGVYVYQLITESYSESKKLIFMK